jgi:hypothetical protein
MWQQFQSLPLIKLCIENGKRVLSECIEADFAKTCSCFILTFVIICLVVAKQMAMNLVRDL